MSGVANRGDFLQNRSAHPVRPRSQPSAIVVGEMLSPGPKLAPQEPVLFNQIRHRLPLTTIQSANQHVQHHLERRGVDHEPEPISRAGLKAVGLEMEHYGRLPTASLAIVSNPTPIMARINTGAYRIPFC